MFDDKVKKYRWFLLFSEAADILFGYNVSNFFFQFLFCSFVFREIVNLFFFVLEVIKNNGVVYIFVILNLFEIKRYINFLEKLVQNLEKVQCNFNCLEIKIDGCDSVCNVNLSEGKICSFDVKQRGESKIFDDNFKVILNLICFFVCVIRKRDLQDKIVESFFLKVVCLNLKQLKSETIIK